jgi:digeranylgeranylglycerophospholipid reductase
MKLDENWDVIVVGAGPGGSVTAMHCAKHGLKTLLLEKRQEIGSPKRCGEGLPLTAVEIISMGVPQYCIRQEIDGAICYSPNGKDVIMNMKGAAGYVIERKELDKWLAYQAARAGAKVQAKTEVTEIIKENDYITGVKAVYQDEEYILKAKIVVAADGIESTIARKAGLNTANQLINVDSGFQFEMANVKIRDQRKLELFFGNEIAPRGYTWIFPKDKDIANVGIGIGFADKSARHYLEKWIESRPDLFKNASIIEVNAGGIPVGGFLDNMVLNGFAVVGDAAHQVNPIHGGGLHEATSAGKILADVIAKGIKNNDLSQEALSEYNTTWHAGRGKRLKKVEKIKQMFDKMSDDDMNLLAESLDGKMLLEMAQGSKIVGLGKLLITRPRLLKLVKHFI